MLFSNICNFIIVKKAIFSFIIIIYSLSLFSQSLLFKDSLELELKNALTEKDKVRILNQLSVYYLDFNLEDSKKCAEKSIKISEENNLTIELIDSYQILSLYYLNIEDRQQQLFYLQKAIDLAFDIQEYEEYEKIQMDIGNIYISLGNYDEAKKFLKKSLEAAENSDDEHLFIKAAGNLANLYSATGELDSSLLLYDKALKVATKNSDNHDITALYSNIGIVYFYKNDFIKALEYYDLALQLSLKNNDFKGIAIAYINIGEAYSMIGEYEKSEDNISKGLKIAVESKFKSIELSSYLFFSELYKMKEDYKNAYYYYDKYNILNDSLHNLDIAKQIIEMQTKFETEKQENLNIILKKENRVQKSWLLISLLFIVFSTIFVLFMIKSNKKVKRVNNELLISNDKIKQKNAELNEFNEEILVQQNLIEKQTFKLLRNKKLQEDSLAYASFIQFTIINLRKQEMDKISHFIFFRPLEIVSGDFYWFRKINNLCLFVVADCTGHGVPGAFLSMLGIAFLNEIIRKTDICSANEVLEELRNQFKNSLHQTGRIGEAKDGMDLALCIINDENGTLQFSGANLPLYIVRNKEIIKFKPTKNPIGIFPNEENFNNDTVVISSEDIIYMFTDGFVDQFGGIVNEKFKYKRFDEMIINSHSLTFEDQHYIFDKTLNEWMEGKAQIDDILILGLKYRA
jgi:serine phosphatase RsbU (regulator of sigma subunit)/tetratricopeptide (TPR) repeat protein